jgi:arsenate reductase (thioredoxin)
MSQKSYLFVCIGNACRSQMAEGFARHYGGEDLIIYSAGSHPLGRVVSESIRSMKEKGIDISHHTSKGIPDVPDIEYDVLVTMGCGDNCPTVRAKKRIDWKIPDPFGGGKDFFNKIRDLIGGKIENLLSGK